MRFVVDLEQCENHGQCAMAAPSLFRLNDEGLLDHRASGRDEHVSAELDAAEVRGAELAASMCPMQAIDLVR